MFLNTSHLDVKYVGTIENIYIRNKQRIRTVRVQNITTQELNGTFREKGKTDKT